MTPDNNATPPAHPNRLSPMQPQPPWVSGAVLGPHIGVRDYLLPKLAGASPPDGPLPVSDNESFWKAVIQGQLTAGMEISLERFRLLNWIPRSPGQFFTGQADWARQEASHHIHPGTWNSPARDHAHSHSSQVGPDYTTVFTPTGKTSMLQGGVGAIRLKPVRIGNESFWLLTATSDGVAHCGVPLAIPLKLFTRWFAELERRGSLCVSLTGELDFLPNPFSVLYDDSVGVQKLFLEVTHIEPAEPTPVKPEVSVAVSFTSQFEGRPSLYATYVTFEPGKEGCFERAVDWMKREYVEGEYRGRILTDFDQTRTIFPEARVALGRIMSRTLTRVDLAETIELMQLRGTVEQYFEALDLYALAADRASQPRTKVFISYAHAAETSTGWVRRMRTHLEGLEFNGELQIWDDTKLQPGERWHKQISSAIREAKVAVLILTPDFLRSQYILQSELPLLLEAAEADGAQILTVYGTAVHLSGAAARLAEYQAVNAPERPLQDMSESERDRLFAHLAKRVEEICSAKNSR